ncbi:MAG: ACP S-malonyltransferase [Gemmatimonadota bacterium]
MIVLCPGQGAQYVGMGKDLAERFPAARETFQEIDDALGVALSRIMWEGPEEELTLTHNAQPAILAHTVAVFRIAGPRLGTARAALGHSLGEYAAYVAAGALPVREAARLVRRRGELMADAGTRRRGTMAAVIGLPTAEVRAACAEATTAESVVVAANLNAPDQTVISGDPEAVERAAEGCRTRGAKRVLPLKVSGAFHSPLMEPAVAGLREALGKASFATPAFPVIANATATPVTSAPEAVRLLAEQLTAPVRFVECVQAAAALAPESAFVEMGPGAVLSGLVKRILPDRPATPLKTPDDLDRFLAA